MVEIKAALEVTCDLIADALILVAVPGLSLPAAVLSIGHTDASAVAGKECAGFGGVVEFVALWTTAGDADAGRAGAVRGLSGPAALAVGFARDLLS